jgi:hypothetical protein
MLKIQLEFICCLGYNIQMTDKLLTLITTKLLPELEQWIDLNTLDLPKEVLQVYTLQKQQHRCWLLQKKSGALAFGPQPPTGKNKTK